MKRSGTTWRPGSSIAWNSAAAMLRKAHLDELKSFTTLDGSLIRELAGPSWTSARNQSLAEATVPAGGETAEHYHAVTEELYYFVAGSGRMRLGDAEGNVSAGDCVVIAPGTPHKLWNPGDEPLVLLCCCAPAYSDDDTVMTGR
jgi:mannose-6-phosphate isomerase-like protein (cupin superfamily)